MGVLLVATKEASDSAAYYLDMRNMPRATLGTMGTYTASEEERRRRSTASVIELYSTSDIIIMI